MSRVATQKAALREQLSSLYREHDLSRFTASAYQQLTALEELAKASHILIYTPLSDEIPCTQPLMEHFPHTSFYVPTSDAAPGFRNTKDGSQWTARDEESIVIVPSRACTAHGERLGRGGGWYDRFLGEHPGLYTISVIPSFALLSKIPTEAHDALIAKVIVCKSEGDA